MNPVNNLIKILLLCLFAFLSFQSFHKNLFNIASNDNLEKVHLVNLHLVNEVSKLNDVNEKSNFRQKTDRYYNYSLSGILINGISNILKVKNVNRLTNIIEVINNSLLVFVFILLLVWLNIEFGFCPSFLTGLAILCSPCYLELSSVITLSVFSMLLPSVLLAFLLLVERLKKTYLQRQISFFLFFTIMLRLGISYRSIFFIMFSTLLIGMYHGIYYKWEKSFTYKRMFSFCKIMIYSFICLCVMQIGIDAILYKYSFLDAFNNLINNLSINFNFLKDDMLGVVLKILQRIYIYPYLTCFRMLILFIIVSLCSFLFYYKVMKVHQRQFYALFLMSTFSFIMALFSSIFENTSESYVALMWMYPSTIFTFAMLGLLIKNICEFKKIF